MCPVPTFLAITAAETVWIVCRKPEYLHTAVSQVTAVHIFAPVMLCSPDITAVSGKSHQPFVLTVGKRAVVRIKVSAHRSLFSHIACFCEFLRPFVCSISPYAQICLGKFLVYFLRPVRRAGICKQGILPLKKSLLSVGMSSGHSQRERLDIAPEAHFQQSPFLDFVAFTGYCELRPGKHPYCRHGTLETSCCVGRITFAVVDHSTVTLETRFQSLCIFVPVVHPAGKSLETGSLFRSVFHHHH